MDRKEQLIKNVIGSQLKYYEVILTHSFTNNEKDILRQAVASIRKAEEDNIRQEAVNINEAKIYQTLINNAYDILKSRSTKSTGTNIKRIATSILIVLIAIILIINFTSYRIDESRKERSEKSTQRFKYDRYGDVHGAWAYMQIFVEKELKSPKSADFPFGGGTYHTTDLGGGRYKVDSYVDATNDFGTKVRTKFHGIIKREKGNWVLEYLNFGNN